MGALSLLVTGAGGFVGREAVAAALARGHKVRALVRQSCAAFAGMRDVECIAFDLGHDRAALAKALRDVDAVIHCAAALGGDDAAMQRDTLAPTRALIDAMSATTPKPRLVLVSSVAVHDADALPENTVIDETGPLEQAPDARDAYTRAKLAQEKMVREAGLAGWIARPGAVYGPGRLWNAHLGPRLGPVLIRLGGAGQIPLVSVRTCAEALVLAAETDPPGHGMLPVLLVDDDLPDRAQFLSALGPRAPSFVLPLSWRILDRLAPGLAHVPGLAPRLPGLLRPRPLRARMRPARYSNAHARAVLGWQPTRFADAMRDALETRP
ncbi:NAD-dependent epimerase/dehydratase family protein [Aquicoccus porphyridii]|uniref:NAD-dependent epimerase/dehydratase family protein n=1 Tax=Aquicoccus porphyridii TaxID=1852029 RepID=A0A5A9ZT20_9RHOB|nr:NAD-dependent epimerase/dehydratase family protein [Aquicoccus porphyridii]KAA0920360.1 NAD-dependent epimerase/dehydratase family protein [Aquicoccus porphyridii]RAI54847.1 NAD(P)-dependent oxidoreductase [Rhodobacteraceae bacterium AsT-22]